MPLPVSYFDIAEHQQDNGNSAGYDYQGNIFANTMSNVIFNDPKRTGILAMMEAVVYQLIQNVKVIKLQYGYTMEKKYRNFN